MITIQINGSAQKLSQEIHQQGLRRMTKGGNGDRDRFVERGAVRVSLQRPGRQQEQKPEAWAVRGNSNVSDRHIPDRGVYRSVVAPPNSSEKYEHVEHLLSQVKPIPYPEIEPIPSLDIEGRQKRREEAMKKMDEAAEQFKAVIRKLKNS